MLLLFVLELLWALYVCGLGGEGKASAHLVQTEPAHLVETERSMWLPSLLTNGTTRAKKRTLYPRVRDCSAAELKRQNKWFQGVRVAVKAALMMVDRQADRASVHFLNAVWER